MCSPFTASASISGYGFSSFFAYVFRFFGADVELFLRDPVRGASDVALSRERPRPRSRGLLLDFEREQEDRSMGSHLALRLELVVEVEPDRSRERMVDGRFGRNIGESLCLHLALRFLDDL